LEETRRFEVECDWCGQILAGQMRRSEMGQIVVAKVEHADLSGRACLGSGRTLGTWPLSVELRETSVGLEIRIGEGRPRVHPSRQSLATVLRGLGVEGGEAVFWAAAVGRGQPITLVVAERRKKPRSRT
jgi:hypothetical protein